jgi:putative copper export protein
MRPLYLLSVWLHILAAAAWIGGMIFLALVLFPVLRRLDLGAGAAEVMHRTAIRFRVVGWTCLLVLVATGVLNLTMWGIGWSDVAGRELWGSRFGRILAAKLTLVALMLALSLTHDFVIGPRAMARLRKEPDSIAAQRLRRTASWMGRFTLLLALAVVALAVMLTRYGP